MDSPVDLNIFVDRDDHPIIYGNSTREWSEVLKGNKDYDRSYRHNWMINGVPTPGWKYTSIEHAQEVIDQIKLGKLGAPRKVYSRAEPSVIPPLNEAIATSANITPVTIRPPAIPAIPVVSKAAYPSISKLQGTAFETENGKSYRVLTFIVEIPRTGTVVNIGEHPYRVMRISPEFTSLTVANDQETIVLRLLDGEWRDLRQPEVKVSY